MIVYNNENQRNEVERVTKALTDKGYRYKLENNFLSDGVIIEIVESVQVKGDTVIFDNGNWYSKFYLINTGLYYNGMVSIDEDLLNLSGGEVFKIVGALPINI